MSDVFLWDKDIREKKTQVMEQFCKKKKKNGLQSPVLSILFAFSKI